MKKKILIGLIIVFILGVSGGYFLWKKVIERRPPEGKVFQVGILCGLDFFSVITDSFKEEMTNLGYIEGENIIYDIQKTNFEPEKEKQILQKFVEDDVDLIFAFPTEVALAAKETAQGTGMPVLLQKEIA
jgi:ABC-type uncharacterized transport system substrate-binding protein